VVAATFQPGYVPHSAEAALSATAVSSANPPQVLLVTPLERRHPSWLAITALGFTVITAANCHEARRIINSALPLGVVFTELSLADGSWWSIRSEIRRAYSPADVVVCLRGDGDQARRVIERGADAVLTLASQAQDLERIVETSLARARGRRREAGC
jgi:DNA-binding NarL/FixJ family response regulator